MAQVTSCRSDLRGLPLWCGKLKRRAAAPIGGEASAEAGTATTGRGCQVPVVEASLVAVFLVCAAEERRFWRRV